MLQIDELLYQGQIDGVKVEIVNFQGFLCVCVGGGGGGGPNVVFLQREG